MLPFTLDQFLTVFREYNTAVWPMQIVFNALALAAIALAVWRTRLSNYIISIILAVLWFWMGIVYHLIFFSSINKAAYVFGALFMLQSLFFFGCGLIRKKFVFRATADARGITGAILILYALVIYPLLGHVFGHVYPESPTFGLPCPMTIFTFGMLLWLVPPVPWHVPVIPALWSVVGFMAALKLGVYEDIGLLISGIITVLWLIFGRKQHPTAVH